MKLISGFAPIRKITSGSSNPTAGASQSPCSACAIFLPGLSFSASNEGHGAAERGHEAAEEGHGRGRCREIGAKIAGDRFPAVARGDRLETRGDLANRVARTDRLETPVVFAAKAVTQPAGIGEQPALLAALHAGKAAVHGIILVAAHLDRDAVLDFDLQRAAIEAEPAEAVVQRQVTASARASAAAGSTRAEKAKPWSAADSRAHSPSSASAMRTTTSGRALPVTISIAAISPS